MTVNTHKIFIVLLGLLFTYFAQGQSVRSQMEDLQSIEDEKVRLDTMLKTSRVHLNNAPDSGKVAAEILVSEAQKIDNQEYIGLGYHYVGVSYAWQGEYDQALIYYNKALQIFESTNDNKSLSIIYNSFGGVYYDQNNFRKAMDYWQKARFYALKSEDGKRIEVSNNNLGALYMAIGEMDKAKPLFYDNLALGIANNWNLTKGISYINLSKLFLKINQLDSAQDFAYKSYTIFKVINNSRGSAEALKCLSSLKFLKDNASDGFALAFKSLEEWEKIGDKYNQGNLLNFIAEQYFSIHKVDSAINYSLKAYDKGVESASLGVLQSSCEILANAYKKKQQYEKAFHFQRELTELNDSILNKEIQQDIIRKEFKYEYQLKSEKDSIDQAKKQEIKAIKHKNELYTQRLWTYIGMGLAILAVFLAIYVFRNLQRKKKDHEAITLSKEIIEEKNREITDSINYAQRIQTAMLPSKERFQTLFPSSFVMYRPKDIVAGDFYWIHEIDNTKYVAVADCTGHGVPGAMMSVVCNSALNRSIREFNCEKPNEILDQSRKLIIEELNNGGVGQMNPIKDGMDVSLVAIQENKMYFSGAYNSVCVIRSHSFSAEEQKIGRLLENHNYNLLEIKGDKQPVGIGVKHIPFRCKEFHLQKDDQLFMYTDGYPDQFGLNTSDELWNDSVDKPQGKKFKSKNMKKLLLQIASLTPDEQRQRLEDVFDKWKSDLEQLDDVCVLGIQI